MRIPSGSTDRYVYFVAVDSTDLKTRETGLTTFTVYASLNGGAAGAFTTPTVNETDGTNMPGVYELLLDEYTTLTAGNDTEELCLHITQASMQPVTRVIEIYRPETTEGNTLDVTSGGAGGVDWGNVENPTTSVGLSNTTVGTCTTNTDMRGTDSALLAASAPTNFGDLSITASTGRVDVASIEGSDATDQIGDSVWDEVIETAHESDGTAGEHMNALAKAILARTNNQNLNALLGVADSAGNDVPAQVLTGETLSELLQGAPAATPSVSAAIMLLYMAARNKIDVTSSVKEIHNDAGTVICKKALSDDGTTYSEAEAASGP